MTRPGVRRECGPAREPTRYAASAAAPRDPEADGRILAAAVRPDPDARLRQHDRRRAWPSSAGVGKATVYRAGPRRRTTSRSPRWSTLYRDEMPDRRTPAIDPRRPATTMFASVLTLRELARRASTTCARRSRSRCATSRDRRRSTARPTRRARSRAALEVVRAARSPAARCRPRHRRSSTGRRSSLGGLVGRRAPITQPGRRPAPAT